MRKSILLCAALAAILATGCSKYDDSELWNKVNGLETEVNDLDRRVSSIEATLTSLNSDIKSISAIVATLQGNIYITKVNEKADGSYQIVFSDGNVITIRSGEDGQTPHIGTNGNWWIGTTDTGVKAKGEDGEDGKTPYVGTNGNWWIGTSDTGVIARGSDGLTPRIGTNGNWWIGSTDTGVKAAGRDGYDGINGTDGKTPYIGMNGNWWIGTSDTGVAAGGGSAQSVPIIGVAKYEGRYYWTKTVNGVTTWLTDDEGRKLPVTGEGGSGGGVTPIIRVNTAGNWIVSYDNGITWVIINDTDGNPTFAGKGCECVPFFQNVYVEGDYLILVLIDGTVVRIYIGGEKDERFDDVVPPEIQDKIIEHMPLYKGVNPPNVEGAYYIDPMVAVYCEDYGSGGYEPGAKVQATTVYFSNQDMSRNTLDYAEKEGDSYSTGQGAFISGSGNNFTAYFDTEGYSGSSTGNIYTKTALVISGTKTDYGIENLYFAFIMVEKGSDPDHKLMDEGVFRVFKDEDGYSETTSWDYGVKGRIADAIQQSGITTEPVWKIYSRVK